MRALIVLAVLAVIPHTLSFKSELQAAIARSNLLDSGASYEGPVNCEWFTVHHNKSFKLCIIDQG